MESVASVFIVLRDLNEEPVSTSTSDRLLYRACAGPMRAVNATKVRSRVPGEMAAHPDPATRKTEARVNSWPR